MMCAHGVKTVWMAFPAIALAIAGSLVLQTPAQAFDPEQKHQRNGSQALQNGMLPPANQAIPSLPPESGLPYGARPPYPARKYTPPPYPTQNNKTDRSHADPKKGQGHEREPSVLYPSDDRDRRALQQMMGHDRARQAVQTGTIRSLTEIRGQVRRQFDGRIVGVELYENRIGAGPDWVYDLRVLNRRGSVVAVEMDARTGRVLAVRGQR